MALILKLLAIVFLAALVTLFLASIVGIFILKILDTKSPKVTREDGTTEEDDMLIW